MEGSSLPEHYCLFDTAFGPCGVGWNGRGLTRLQLPEGEAAATEARLTAHMRSPTPEDPPPAIAAAIGRLRAYFDGEPMDFSTVVLDLGGESDFHRGIYAATRAITWGRTATYGELASRVGQPGAARAVGHAMARNPLPIVIPCHRVLASGNRIGGFSAHGGTLTKERLLWLEGVATPDTAQLSLGFG